MLLFWLLIFRDHTLLTRMFQSLSPYSVTLDKEPCVKDEFFTNGDIVVVFGMAIVVGKDGCIIDLLDHVSRIVIIGVLCGMYSFLIINEGIGYGLAPFLEKMIKKVEKSLAGDSDKHISQSFVTYGWSPCFHDLHSALSVFLYLSDNSLFSAK